MNWLKAFVVASVGKKYLMGLTGLFLCFFLVVHLAGNVLLYVGNDAYNEYAHKLHSNAEFLILAEILLFTAFAVHIAYGFWLHFGNRAARDQRYAFVQSKRADRKLNPAMPTPDKTMFFTGLVVLMFLVVHISDFKLEFGWGPTIDGYSRAEKAQIVVANTVRFAIYLTGAVFLGIHVSHGLQSSFQSIGFNHSKYTPAIRKLSLAFGLIVAIGFGSFPVVAQIQNWGKIAESPPTSENPETLLLDQQPEN